MPCLLVRAAACARIDQDCARRHVFNPSSLSCSGKTLSGDNLRHTQGHASVRTLVHETGLHGNLLGSTRLEAQPLCRSSRHQPASAEDTSVHPNSLRTQKMRAVDEGGWVKAREARVVQHSLLDSQLYNTVQLPLEICLWLYQKGWRHIW